MKKKYKSEILMVAHMMMEDAYKLGLATDEEMRECDEDCLVTEPEFSPSNSSSPRGKPVIPAYAKT
jgi:DNA-binding transcriptional regulator YiaG